MASFTLVILLSGRSLRLASFLGNESSISLAWHVVHSSGLPHVRHIVNSGTKQSNLIRETKIKTTTKVSDQLVTKSAPSIQCSPSCFRTCDYTIDLLLLASVKFLSQFAGSNNMSTATSSLPVNAMQRELQEASEELFVQ
ncbi:hypothetical protein Tco_0939630 [Tanacetum coccineum]|uniref:Uncharacterized protein n=1 Tax=Tanacetum coccineum TaxID=301880 RepID=A0ABQ5DKQ2_9ASTR